MKKRVFLSVIALMMAVVLTGCSAVGFWEYLDRISDQIYGNTVKFSDMVYARPDMHYITGVLDSSCAAAGEGSSLDEVLSGVMDYYDAYYGFNTRMALANIHYCADLTDEYWQGEYEYCSSCASEMQKGLETLYRALAASPLRGELEGEDYFGAGFFDDYDGDTVWTDDYMELTRRESDLINQYYDLCGQATEEPYSDAYYSAWLEPMGQVLADLAAVRGEIARYMGYSDYAAFANAQIFGRQYTVDETQAYLDRVGQVLVPVFTQELNAHQPSGGIFGQRDTLEYVRSAARAMGGEIRAAEELMEKAELYDIAFGENKFEGSFETYLDSYNEPFIFLNPSGTGSDLLGFAHEFGHFAGDYVCGGSYAGTDVSEVLSQGMEYLSLCYADVDDGVRRMLTRGKLLDSLSTYVEAAAYASFENRLYRMTEAELTVENIRMVYGEVMAEYGFDSWGWDDRDFITVHHLYTNPLYMFSYAVSNDLALQIYQLELDQPGQGLRLYEKCLYTQESDLAVFAADAGLEDPMAPGRLEKAAELLRGEG